MENADCKKENIKRKYWNNMQQKQFQKVKNSLWELEKGFIELEHRELKYRKVKLKERWKSCFLN